MKLTGSSRRGRDLKIGDAALGGSGERAIRFGGLAVLTGAYLLLSFANLDRFPVVHEDEPYIAASAAHLAATGEYGNPMFAGFHGAERHVYLHPPLLALLQAGVFRTMGVSTVSMRIPTVLAGLAVLVLTFAAGVRAGGGACGFAAATALLVLAPTGGWNGTSGVPLLDIARVARYDILVPAFGLAALLTFDSARGHAAALFRLMSGVLAGTATIAHVYGGFWLIALLLVLLLREPPDAGRLRASLQLGAGFLLAMLPLAIWILSNWNDFVGQQQLLVERYDVLDPRFLLDNLMRERFRYRPVLAFADPWRSLWTSPGLWIVLVGVPVALVSTLRASGTRRTGRTASGSDDARALPATGSPAEGSGLPVEHSRESLAFAIAIALVVHVTLFALLVQVKTYNYLIAVWPLAVLLLARTITRTWRHAGPGAYNHAVRQIESRAVESMPVTGRKPEHNIAIYTILVGALFAAAAGEGVVRIVRWQAGAHATTAYASFTQRIATHVPEGGRVLGLQRFWLGPGSDYISWLVPVWWNDPRFTDGAVPLDVAIDRVGPDVILIDDAMQRYFDGLADTTHPQHARFLEWRRYIERRDLTMVATVDDVTYGSVRIWR